MLILAHTDGLGVDFYKLCQRILEPPGNGNGGPEVHVILREFLRGQGRSGVDGGTGFVDDGIACLRERPKQLNGHGFRLSGGSAVANGNMPNAEFAHQTGKCGNGLLLFPFIKSGIYYAGSQHFAGGIYYCNLAAIAVSGVQAHGDEALYGGLHQQRLQVQSEVVDGSLAGPVCQGIADFSLDGWEDQPLVGILGGGLHHLGYLHGGL